MNGVLFTGGWAKNGLYFEVLEGIFKVIAALKTAQFAAQKLHLIHALLN